MSHKTIFVQPGGGYDRVVVGTSEAGTPEQTIQKAAQIRRAALAPADPSSKDRQVADQRHQETAVRLRVHDRALGVDTTHRVAEPEPIVHLAPPPVPAASLPDPLHDYEWYFVLQGQRQGPIGFAELREAFDAGDLQPETLVWCSSMEDWSPLRDRRDLQEALLA